MENETVNVRYMAENVEASMEWYVAHLSLSLISKYPPAFADVQRGAAWGDRAKDLSPWSTSVLVAEASASFKAT